MHADWGQHLNCDGHGRHLPTQVAGQQQHDGQPLSRDSGRYQWSQEEYPDTVVPQTISHHSRSRASRDAVQPTPRQMPDPISGHMAHPAERLQADMRQAAEEYPGTRTGQMQQADALDPGMMMNFQQAWGHDERVDHTQHPMWVPPEQQDTHECYPVQAPPAYHSHLRESMQQHSMQAHNRVSGHMQQQQQRRRPQAMQACHGGAQHMQQQQEGRAQGTHAYQSTPSPMQQQGGGYNSYPPASGKHQQRCRPGNDVPPFDHEYNQGGPPCAAILGAMQGVAQQQHGRSAPPAYRRDPDLPEAPMHGAQYVSRRPHPRAQAMRAGGMLSSAYAAGPEAVGRSPSHEYPAGQISHNCALQTCRKYARLALATTGHVEGISPDNLGRFLL